MNQNESGLNPNKFDSEMRQAAWQAEKTERHMKADTAAADHIICIPRDRTCNNHERRQDHLIPIISVLNLPVFRIYSHFRYRNFTDSELTPSQNRIVFESRKFVFVEYLLHFFAFRDQTKLCAHSLDYEVHHH